MSDQTATFTPTQHDILGTGKEWERIRDFVSRSIEERWGPRVRNQAKEDAIFKSFLDRYGDTDAWYVARSAVVAHRCIWREAPLSVERFSASNDEYFADVILSRR